MPHNNTSGRLHMSSALSRSIARLDVSLSVYSNIVTFVLAYVLTLLVLFCFGAAGEYGRWPNDKHRAFAIGAARGFGYALNLNVALVIILASKGVLTMLRRTALNAVIPFDKAMPKFHALVGYVTFFCACMHGVCHSIGGFPRGMWALSDFGEWRYCVATGLVLLIVFSIMVSTAVKRIRDANFERFIYVHLIGAAMFFVLLTLHGFYLGKFYTYKWIAGPCGLYIIDRVHRKMKEKAGTVFIRVNTRACQGNGIIRLEIPRVFRFKAGQYAEIKIPSISKGEWHPFTIASAPYESTMRFYIKSVGAENSWTRRLHEGFSKEAEFSSICEAGELAVHCRGPYGAPAEHSGQYDRMILVSGGVGATPFLSIAKHIGNEIGRFSNTINAAQTSSIGYEDNGSLNGANSSDSGDDQSSDDEELDVVDFADVGVSVAVGGRMAKKRNPAKGVDPTDLKKRPTLRRTKSSESSSEAKTESWSDFFLCISYSMCLNTGLLWLLLTRLAANLIALAFHASDPAKLGTEIFSSRPYLFLDFCIGVLICSTFGVQLLVETCAETLDLIDLLFAFPCVSFHTVVEGLALGGVLRNEGDFTAFSFYFFWPAALFTFLLRYFRIMGHRILLVESMRSDHREVRSLDFVWTSPTRDDDDWLCKDLASALSGSKEVRLHRFLTRESMPDVENKDASAIPGFKNNYGRPDFASLFDVLTKNSPNGTTVGVFVCGPLGLTAAVKQAAINAMIKSREEGMKFKARLEDQSDTPGDGFDQDAQFDETEVSVYDKGYGRGRQTLGRVEEDWRRSFNVRFIVREENF